MKLIVAETGGPPRALRAAHSGYAETTAAMLERAGGGFSLKAVCPYKGEPVPAPADADALLLTGSPASAYDDAPWIAGLIEGVRGWIASGKPVVGICFGHQLMAQALGGRVEKSEHGWGLGVHTYEVTAKTGLEPEPARLSSIVTHQDQVAALPPGATRLAGSAFCPNGIIHYGEGRALSFQMHPEFEPGFAAALLDLQAPRLLPDVVALARAGLSHPTDRLLIGDWIARFLKGDVK